MIQQAFLKNRRHRRSSPSFLITSSKNAKLTRERTLIVEVIKCNCSCSSPTFQILYWPNIWYRRTVYWLYGLMLKLCPGPGDPGTQHRFPQWYPDVGLPAQWLKNAWPPSTRKLVEKKSNVAASIHSLGQELETGSKHSLSLSRHCCLHFYKLASAGSLEFVDPAAFQDVLGAWCAGSPFLSVHTTS